MYTRCSLLKSLNRFNKLFFLFFSSPTLSLSLMRKSEFFYLHFVVYMPLLWYVARADFHFVPLFLKEKKICQTNVLLCCDAVWSTFGNSKSCPNIVIIPKTRQRIILIQSEQLQHRQQQQNIYKSSLLLLVWKKFETEINTKRARYKMSHTHTVHEILNLLLLFALFFRLDEVDIERSNYMFSTLFLFLGVVNLYWYKHSLNFVHNKPFPTTLVLFSYSLVFALPVCI